MREEVKELTMGKPDVTLDLKGVPCPANAARALLKLAAMNDGETLELLVDSGEALQNVPESVRQEGHTILLKEPHEERWRILVRVGTEERT